MLIGVGEPVFHRAGHVVGLEPDYIVAEYPAVMLECDGNSPRDTKKLFWLKPIRSNTLFYWVDGGDISF